jgi:hypothetical protein
MNPIARGLAALLAVASVSTAATPAMAIEEPDYRVVRTIDEVEIRDYAPFTVAEVEIDGPASEAGGKAFPILAGYIFGKNKGERRLPMTAPVTQTEAPGRMAMTAPVTQTPTSGGQVVQFVLPKGVTVASAPEPLDARVQVRAMPERRFAVLRYSGLWSVANDEAHRRRLEDVLSAAGLVVIGEPTYARYNAPFTPWFLRRNEVWIPIAVP